MSMHDTKMVLLLEVLITVVSCHSLDLYDVLCLAKCYVLQGVFDDTQPALAVSSNSLLTAGLKS